jgi:dihydrofolate synthase/folylpolyglutamate synthase
MPASIEAVAASRGTPLYRRGREFRVMVGPECWSWIGPHGRFEGLPFPTLRGRHQVDNAAGAIMALELLDVPLDKNSLSEGLKRVFLPGRLQRLSLDGVEWWLDVAHNPHAVKALRQLLETTPVTGATHALVGLLADKPAEAVLEIMAPVVDHWHHATLVGSRGREAATLAAIRPGALYPSVRAGVEALRRQAVAGERVVVFGSFLTVGEALEALQGKIPTCLSTPAGV